MAMAGLGQAEAGGQEPNSLGQDLLSPRTGIIRKLGSGAEPELDAGTPAWAVGIPYSVLTARPNIQP